MQRDLPHLSTHCLQHWRDEMQRAGASAFAAVMGPISRDLERAVKFVLPDGGRVVDDYRGVARLFHDLRLPFPVVALEYRSTGVVADHETPSSKRIALVWDGRHAVPSLLQARGAAVPGAPCLYVQSISYMDDYGLWAPVMATAHVDLTLAPVVPQEGDVSPLEMELVRHRLRPGFEKTPAFPIRFLPHMPAVVQQLGGEEAADAIFRADSADEISAALAFAAVSSCANVRMQAVPAPGPLNAKREKGGKVPFFETRVLEIEQDGFVVRAGEAAGRGGTHASPRAHLRRGHIRHVGDRNVWINATTVNAWRAEPNAALYSVRRSAEATCEGGEEDESPRPRC